MNYYERHLGDYAKDTAHLTMIEHGAYGLLLDRYYATEQGIPADQVHRVARARTKEEKHAVDTVLAEFFSLVDGVWVNGRAEEEIAKAQTRIKAAHENGKRGGRPKKKAGETEQKPGGLSVGSQTETQSKAHQTPDTNISTDVDIKSAKRRFDPLAIHLPTGIPADSWERWIAYRRGRKLTTSQQTITAQVENLASWSSLGHDPAQIIADSIANGWQGLFEPKAIPATGSGPARISHSDQSKLAAARAIFGTAIEGENHGTSARVIDVTPTVTRRLGG